MALWAVNWSLGGRDVVEADTASEAQDIVCERIPKIDYDWRECEVLPATSEDRP